ncbi:MAG: acetylornithine deacetylase [Acidobacteriaceae bacterium]
MKVPDTNLDSSAVVNHLSNLIRIPSVSGISNRPVTKYASSVLKASGWTTREVTYIDESGTEKVNLIAAPPGQGVEDRTADLAFLCHTDTVPYANDWQHALQPLRQGEMLHGCGACDVKGFLACLLVAAESKDTEWISGLRMVFTADEEIGCIGTKRLIASDSLRPKRLVIGEPTSLRAARAGKGYCLARITIQGREAHSALPAQGISAIYAAARLVSGIEELAKQLMMETHDFFDPGFTTLNVGTIQGGSAKNIIPGRTDLILEWRPIPGLSRERVSTEIRKIVASVETQYPGVNGSLVILREDPGFEAAADSPLVKSIESATGQPATSIAFGSEASAWSAIAEEVIVFGPGDMRTAHSNRECVSVDELSTAVRVITNLMQGRSGIK